MMVLRFLAVAFAFIITFTIAQFTHIPTMDMLVLVSFILTIDALCVRFIHRQYMLSVLDDMGKNKKDGEE